MVLLFCKNEHGNREVFYSMKIYLLTSGVFYIEHFILKIQSQQTYLWLSLFVFDSCILLGIMMFTCYIL